MHYTHTNKPGRMSTRYKQSSKNPVLVNGVLKGILRHTICEKNKNKSLVIALKMEEDPSPCHPTKMGVILLLRQHERISES